MLKGPLAGFTIDTVLPGAPEADTWRIVYIKQGRLGCNLDSGLSFMEAPGIAFIKPGSDRRIRLAKDAKPVACLALPALVCLSMEKALVGELLLRTGARGILGAESPALQLFPLEKQDEPRYEGIFRVIQEERHSGAHGSSELILLRLAELLLLLERHDSDIHPQPDIRKGACRPEDIDGWLREHFCEPLSLELIAKALGYSPTWLSRLYRSRTGSCLFEEVNRLRIERACYLLKYSNKSVTDIAFEVGYNNVSFFNRMFRRHLLINPQGFRDRSK